MIIYIDSNFYGFNDKLCLPIKHKLLDYAVLTSL